MHACSVHTHVWCVGVPFPLGLVNTHLLDAWPVCREARPREWADVTTGAEVSHFLAECMHGTATMRHGLSFSLVYCMLLSDEHYSGFSTVSDSHHEGREDGAGYKQPDCVLKKTHQKVPHTFSGFSNKNFLLTQNSCKNYLCSRKCFLFRQSLKYTVNI